MISTLFYFYFKFILFCVILNFFLSFFIFLKSTWLKKNKNSYYEYKYILLNYSSIWSYRILYDQIYTLIDFFFDYKFFFKNLKIYFKWYKFIILIITIFIGFVVNLIFLIINWTVFLFYFIKIILIKLFKKNTIIAIPDLDIDFTFKNFFKMMFYNIKLIALYRVLFLLKNDKNKFDFKKIYHYFIWNFSYLMIFGKSFIFIKFLLLSLEHIIMLSLDQILQSNFKKLFKIRIKIYFKIFKKNLIWNGSQIFFKTYNDLYTCKNFKFNNGKLI